MILVDMQLDGIVALKAREINDAAREGLAWVGNEWKSRFRPEHFKHSAFSRYRGAYKPRRGQSGSGKKFKGSYHARKIRVKGHSKPLVWSGESERLSRSARVVARASARASRASCMVKLPQGFNRRHPNSQIRMQDEIRAVIPSELKYLTEGLVERFERGIEKRGQVKIQLSQV